MVELKYISVLSTSFVRALMRVASEKFVTVYLPVMLTISKARDSIILENDYAYTKTAVGEGAIATVSLRRQSS